jgi:hypothetical protein
MDWTSWLLESVPFLERGTREASNRISQNDRNIEYIHLRINLLIGTNISKIIVKKWGSYFFLKMKKVYYQKKISYYECENKKVCVLQSSNYFGFVWRISNCQAFWRNISLPSLLSDALKKCNIAVSTCQSIDTYIHHNIKSSQ